MAVAQKVTKEVEKNKPKSFLVADLRAPAADPAAPPGSAPPIAEAEAALSNELVDSRMRFVQKCQNGHWQFDSLVRAHWSTMMLLASLGGPPRPAGE